MKIEESFTSKVIDNAKNKTIENKRQDVLQIQFEDPEVERICHEHGVYTINDARQVTSIKGWFKDNTSIETFNEFKFFTGLKEIEEFAFSWCKSLKSITIPITVTSIGRSAFSLCKQLVLDTLPEGVTYIGYWAFFSCYSIQSIKIPDSVTIIDDYAFLKCYSMQSINIPVSVKRIGRDMFNECTDLETIYISKNCPVYNKIKDEYPNIQLVDPNDVNESFTSKVIDKKKSIENDQKEKMNSLNLIDYDTFCKIVENECERYFDISVTSSIPGEYKITFQVFGGDDIIIRVRIMIVKEGLYEQDQKDFFTICCFATIDDKYDGYLFNRDNFYIPDAKLLPVNKYILRNNMYQDYLGFPYYVCSTNLPILKNYIKEIRKWKDYIMREYTTLFYNPGYDSKQRKDKILNCIKHYAIDNLMFTKSGLDWYTYMSHDLNESIQRRQHEILERWETFKNQPKFKDSTIYYVMNSFFYELTEGHVLIELNHFYQNENSLIYEITTQDSSKVCRKSHNLELCEGWTTCKDKYELDYSPHKEMFEEVVLNDLKHILVEYNLEINKTKKSL